MRGAAVTEEDKLTAEQARRVMRRAFRMLRPYRVEVLVAVAVMVLWTLCTLAGPFLLRYAIDHGLRVNPPRASVLDRAAIAFVVIAIATMVLSRTQILLVTRVGEKFLRDMRIRVFDHLQGMSMGFFDKEQTGRLVARMTSDMDALQELVQQG